MKYALLVGGDDNQIKNLAYQTSWDVYSYYIQCYITENPDSTWEELKSELSVRFAEVCDPHHNLPLLHNTRQNKSETVHAYAERLHTLAHYTFMKLFKAVVESQLLDFLYDGLYHDYL